MRFASLATLCALCVSVPAAFGQQASLFSSSSDYSVSIAADPAPGGAGVSVAYPSATGYSRPFSGLALGVKAGLLGVGVEAATPLARRFNLRGGTNFFSYSDNLSSDGINYDANLRFRSGEASVDWFPWAKAFHVSPGALLYNGNQLTAAANVPAGRSFTLNNTNYTSGIGDPVTGNGSVTFSKAAPKLTVGLGNMLPRSGRHFSVPFEVGFAYVEQPKVTLNLQGTACYNQQGAYYCEDVATDSRIQANVTAERQKLVNDLAPARFYPLLSSGFSFAF